MRLNDPPKMVHRSTELNNLARSGKITAEERRI